MRYLIAVVLLAASVRAEDIQIRYVPMQTGDKTTLSTINSMAVKLTVKGGGESFTREQTLDESTKMTKTVLDSGKNGPTQMRVDYVTDDHTATSPEGVERGSQVVEGKSYVVTAATGEPRVAYAGEEKLVSMAEIEMVLEDFQEFGKTPRFSKLFDGQSFKQGEKVKIDDKAADGLFGGVGTLSGLTVTLKEVRKGDFDVAVFDADITFTRRDGGLVFTAPLKGEIAVGVQNAWPVKIAVSGAITISGKKPAELNEPEKTAEGGGKMKFSAISEYGKAAK
jgi:hypothetical protein